MKNEYKCTICSRTGIIMNRELIIQTSPAFTPTVVMKKTIYCIHHSYLTRGGYLATSIIIDYCHRKRLRNWIRSINASFVKKEE